jgi:uncharacterized membrane protein YfcA
VVAIGTDLAYGAITKTVGGWRHVRAGTVDLGVSKWLAVGSVPGSIVGVLLVETLHRHYGAGFNETLLTIVAAALFVVAISILGRALFLRPRERHSVDLSVRGKVGAATIGLVLGVVLGMTSVGSGALVGLALIAIFRLTPHRVVGTDVFHAAVLLWAASIGHIAAGNVDYGLMLNLLAGSIPGVWIGTAWSGRISTPVLRHALGIVLITASFGLMTKAGAPLPLATMVIVPLVLGGVAAVNARRARQARAQKAESEAALAGASA